MKGLLIKDANLLKGQKQFFGVVAIIMFFFIFAYDNYAFVISYVTIMFSILVITTMSYDDYEKGMCYLMCLPVSRKIYVKEKYIFSLLSVFCGMTIAVLMVLISVAVKKDIFLREDILSAIVASILVASLAVGITLPIQLKFGAEKSRMALMMVFGVGFLGTYFIVKLCVFAGIDVDALLNDVFVQNMAITIVEVIVLSIVVQIVSYLISVRVMMKREF